MGLEELTCFKFIVMGSGQVRECCPPIHARAASTNLSVIFASQEILPFAAIFERAGSCRQTVNRASRLLSLGRSPVSCDRSRRKPVA